MLEGMDNVSQDLLQAITTGGWRYVAAVALIFVAGAVKKLIPAAKGIWAWVLPVAIGAASAAGLYLGGAAFSWVGLIGATLAGAFTGAGAAGLWKGVAEAVQAVKKPTAEPAPAAPPTPPPSNAKPADLKKSKKGR
jgi:hypothetical protein